MKRIVLIYLCSITLGCVAKNSVDYRNFAIDTYFPTPNEISLAEARATTYWNRNTERPTPGTATKTLLHFVGFSSVAALIFFGFDGQS